MKKIISLSLVAATLLFTGCGEKAKDSATDAAAKAVESTKEATSSAVDATKEAADKAVEAAKEATAKAVEATKEAADKAVEATKEAASEAVDSTKEGVAAAAATATAAVADTAENVAGAAENVAGAAAYAKCAGCHGADGKTKALGKSPLIAGIAKDELITMINGYKAGTRDVAGMGTLMKGQVATLDDASIEAVATYISTLK